MLSARIGYHKGEAVELVAKPLAYIKDFKRNLDWVKSMLDDVPSSRLRGHLASSYVKTYHSQTALRPERAANIALRKKVAYIKKITEHLPLSLRELNSKRARKSKAKEFALHCNQLQIVSYDESTTLEQVNKQLMQVYAVLASFCVNKNVKAPYKATIEKALKKSDLNRAADFAEFAVRRMVCPKWWERKLQRMRDVALEHIQIAMGFVKNGVSAYASKDCISEFRAAKRSQAQWLESMQLVSECGEITLNLAEVFKGTVANPELRRIELMVRIRGYDEYAEQNGMDAVFYTVTAPSAYHASSSKYNGASPSDTQKFLVTQWAKVRATLAKENIKLFGVRVVEPHHDATPHWHMLLFMLPQHKARINEVIEHFALQVDGDEVGADEHRFKAKDIDRAQGSAVGYIAKYISKNINENHIGGEIDNETNQQFSADSALCVGAWASRWRIRQFQFVGGCPVGVWRELRRADADAVCGLGDVASALFGFADSSKYAQFLSAMGGAFVTRKELPLNVLRVESGLNDYQEKVFKTTGLAASAGASIVTRAYQWKIEKRRDSGATWSTGNNCNSQIKRQLNESEKPYFLSNIPREARASVLAGQRFFEYCGENITAHYIQNGYYKKYNLEQGHLCH